MSTCATCKHWEIDETTLKYLNDPEVKDKWGDAHCHMLLLTVEIEENEVTGYGTDGRHGIAKIETPWDFGCNKWEAK